MRTNQRGFTLLETIVTLVIVALSAVAIIDLFTNVVSGMIYSRSASASAENIQAALTRITHELANMDTKRNFTLASNSVTYYYRQDANASTIQLTGSNLELNGNTLLNNVTAFSLAKPANSISVSVSMTVNVPTPTPGTTTSKVFSTYVNLNPQRFQ